MGPLGAPKTMKKPWFFMVFCKWPRKGPHGYPKGPQESPKGPLEDPEGPLRDPKGPLRDP